jgi:hypothetical protein
MLLLLAFYASSPLDTGAASYVIDSVFGFLVLVWLAGGSPAASHFLLLRQKKSNQRKGDPTVCVPSLRYGQPAVLSQNGVSLELAALRQSRALSRFAFRSSAHTEGRWGRDRVRIRIRIRGICEFLTFCLRSRIRFHPVLAGPVMIEKSGIRAARCLSRRRVCADPRFSQAAQVA